MKGCNYMSKSKSKIQLNNFYHLYGGGRHTSFVYKKNSEKKTYTSLKFGTTKTKDSILIKPIDGKKTKYVHKRPYEGKRSDYGSRPLDGMSLNQDDSKTFEEIKQRRPKLTRRAKNNYKKMPSSD